MSTRDEYATKMKLQIDELNTAMSEMEVTVHEARQDVREKYTAGMSTLRQQSMLAMAKLDEIKAANEASWGNLVAEAEKVQNAFVHTIHYFKSQLQGAPQSTIT